MSRANRRTIAAADASAPAFDAAELIAGTDPIDPAAHLRATLDLLGAAGPVAVSWPSVIGRIYHVESATSLAPGANWQTVSNHIAADGGRLTVQDPLTPPSNRCYRIGVRLAP